MEVGERCGMQGAIGSIRAMICVIDEGLLCESHRLRFILQGR